MNNQANPLDEILKRQHELDELINQANQAKIESSNRTIPSFTVVG
ncbi:MAG: hypothetical protein ACEQSC_01745 [Candidatus Nanopelagicaceae bacterium]